MVTDTLELRQRLQIYRRCHEKIIRDLHVVRHRYVTVAEIMGAMPVG